MTAPLQVLALTFRSGPDAEDAILAEVDRLQGRGVLRVLDLVVLAKDQDGAVEQLELGDDEDFGSLLGGIVGPAGGAGPRRAALTRPPSSRRTPAPWRSPCHRAPRWPSCWSSITGPRRCLTSSPRRAAR